MSIYGSKLVDAIKPCVTDLKGPTGSGWYEGRCPFPDHTDRRASFGFTDRGFDCKGCGRQGTLRSLAKDLGIDVPSSAPEVSEVEARARLKERGIRSETIRHFAIEYDERTRAWRFPIGPAVKMKAFDSAAKRKYWWDGGQPDSGADVYNLQACNGEAEVWLVEGEPDVWIAHQAGLPALSLTTGAHKQGKLSRRMEAGLREMVAAGVTTVNVCYDNDEAGRHTATAIARRLVELGSAAWVRPLPADVVGPKGDVTDLYRALGHDDERLRGALNALPSTSPAPGMGAGANKPDRNPEVVTASAPEWLPPIELGRNDVPVFPSAVFPTWLQEMVEQVARSTQTPVDLAALFALAVVSTAVARRLKVAVRDDWEEPTNIYVAAFLGSGNRKSAVYKAMVSPVAEFEQAEKERLGPEVELRRQEKEALEAHLKKVTRALAETETAEDLATCRDAVAELNQRIREIGPTTEPQLMADSSTPEKLVSLLASNGGRMAVLEPEGDGFFGMLLGRYSGNPDLTPYLKGYTGETIRVSRMSRSEFVKHPALTIGIAAQPSVLESLRDNPRLRGTGVLARFVYSIPADMVGRRANQAPPVERRVRETYEHRIGALLRGAALFGEENGVHTIALTPSAAEEMVRWMNWIEPRLLPTAELGPMNDWGSKLAGQTARVAALLHVADQVTNPGGWTRPIDASTVRRAVEVARYLVPHALAANRVMGQDVRIADAEHVLRWIDQQTVATLSARDLFEGVKGRLHSMAALRSALGVLIEHGYLREVTPPHRGGRGRKPSPKYEINPLARTQYSQNSQKAGGGDRAA